MRTRTANTGRGSEEGREAHQEFLLQETPGTNRREADPQGVDGVELDPAVVYERRDDTIRRHATGGLFEPLVVL